VAVLWKERVEGRSRGPERCFVRGCDPRWRAERPTWWSQYLWCRFGGRSVPGAAGGPFSGV